MIVEIPKFVETLPIAGYDNRAVDTPPWAMFNDRDSTVFPVDDILIQRKLEIRTVWQKLRHVKLWEAYGDPSKSYTRDNPVIHIKCVDPTWTPKLSDAGHRVWDGDVLASLNGIYGPWEYNTALAGAPLLIWTNSTRISYGTQFYFGETELRGTKIRLFRITVKTALQMGSDGRRTWSNTEYFGWGDNDGLIGSIGDVPPNRWTLESMDLLNKARYHVFRGTNTTDSFSFAPDYSREKIIDQIHAEMMRALRYNEPELFESSSKKESLENLETPALQIALGTAWDQCLQPHGDPSNPQSYNPGLATLGFNNLQNLAGLVDGLLLLASVEGMTEGISRALGDAVSLRSSRSQVMERLTNIGKHSKYKMTHDPDWMKLTPTQQRQLVRHADITSIENSLTASMALTPMQDARPDWMARIGDPDYASWWFQGRYVWSTSWSDAEQAYRYIWDQMQRKLDPLYVEPTLHGRATLDDDAVVRVSFKARERALTGYANFVNHLYTAGLAPTPAVLWDFVPFSFVVDWFFPISESLEQFSRNKFYAPLYYEYYDGFCCSLKYKQRTPAGFTVQCYTRWYQGNCPAVDIGHTMLDGGKSSSDLTTAFRFTDGCLLLFRR